MNTISKCPAAGVGRQWRLRLATGAAACLLLPTIALACSVPVFRFALEQWRPDAYQVFVYHDEDLSDQQLHLIERLQGQAAAGGGANVQVRAIDVRGEVDAADQRRRESLGNAPLPQMVVHLPKGTGGGEVFVGSSQWNEQEVDRLIHSPARTELAQRLIDGQVVWVLLGTGDTTADDSRLTRLETELAALQETLELPAIAPEDLKEMSVEPEALAIRFSALHVDRNDPAESWFVEMLRSTEPDLRDEEIADEAMVFPVFGRGRALYALVGQGINADMIKEAAEFLTGPCQCTVKAENPGVDLLIPLRWDQYIVPTEPEAVSLPLVGLGSYQRDAETDLPLAEDSALVSTGESAATGTTVTPRGPDNRAAARPVAGILAQTEVAAERSALTLWLPWVVMILLAIIVVIASVGFFRRQ